MLLFGWLVFCASNSLKPKAQSFRYFCSTVELYHNNRAEILNMVISGTQLCCLWRAANQEKFATMARKEELKVAFLRQYTGWTEHQTQDHMFVKEELLWTVTHATLPQQRPRIKMWKWKAHFNCSCGIKWVWILMLHYGAFRPLTCTHPIKNKGQLCSRQWGLVYV